MGRSRVLSFISALSGKDKDRNSGPPSPIERTAIDRVPVDTSKRHVTSTYNDVPPRTPPTQSRPFTAESSTQDSPQPPPGRVTSRPSSMVSAYNPPMMDVGDDTEPELQPIFTFLNSHADKLYQEGYFLKLDDQNSQGKPNADRTWTECFAQLVGTVLSFWDAAELDAAGEDGEVLPKFLNLTDASIKMIEALPTRNSADQPLQNVLSISTAGKNRYLLHFNSHHSLIQWTAGIRLAMYEYATLQECYTGALIAGKGRNLNNINLIMERNKFVLGDWVRVRFGAGTPWRRCWCVITPPPEKEFNKLQKEMNKKKSAYDRSRPAVLRGDIKFYDTKKTKKVMPIATLTDAYCAYAIFPQSKPLIDSSTLIKIEGTIMIHSKPPTSSEGFVFVMPDVHPAVSGFEMMLRWLFPAMDTFALYGRPGKLIADKNNTQGLMFAMPTERRYGYLEILDVTSLILTSGSANWNERQWRDALKDMTKKRMAAIADGSRQSGRFSMSSQRRPKRHSIAGVDRSRINWSDTSSIRSSPSIRFGSAPPSRDEQQLFATPPRTDSAPPVINPNSQPSSSRHHRAVSEAQGADRYSHTQIASSSTPSLPLAHAYAPQPVQDNKYASLMGATPGRGSLEDEREFAGTPVEELQDMQQVKSVEPVAAPPRFAHAAGTLPPSQTYQSPERRPVPNRVPTSQNIVVPVIPPLYNMDDMPQASHLPRTEQEPNGNGSENHGQQRVHYPDTIERESNANQHQPKVLVSRNNPITRYERPAIEHEYTTSATYSPLEQDFRTLGPAPETGRPQASRSRSSITRKPLSKSFLDKSSMGSTSDMRNLDPLNTSDSAKQTSANPYSTLSETMSTCSTPDIVDSAGFGKIVPRNSGSQTPIVRQESMASRYDDVPSDNVLNKLAAKYYKPPVEKPRMGIKKTVGSEHVESALPTTDVPTIDFGPTYNYASLPTTRSNSPPIDDTYVNEPVRREDEAARQIPRREVPRYTNTQDSAQVAWRPGMTINNAPQALTPEQYIAHKSASAAIVPQYAHHRIPSSGDMRPITPPVRPTPPPHVYRNSTYMETRPLVHNRSSSDGLSAGKMSSNLTARERQHIARLTGQPLIDMSSSRVAVQPANVGLLGAIESRQIDKQNMKSVMNSQAVEQQIRERQFLQHNAHAQRNTPTPFGDQQMRHSAMPGQFYAQSAGWSSSPHLVRPSSGGQQHNRGPSTQYRG